MTDPFGGGKEHHQMAIGTGSSGRGTALSRRSVAGRWRGNGRRAAALSGCLLLLVLVAAFVAASSFAGTSANAFDKVDPAVVKAVDGGGQTTFWAVLHEQADLSAAPAMKDAARGEFVYDRLNSVANESQGGLRSLLEQQSASFKPFWIINAIRIRGDAALLQTVAARSEVEQILPDRTYTIPKPLPGGGQPGTDVVEWNIDRIRAPLVWSTFTDKGENIVVANIDTGVQFNHNALVAQYRGNIGGGNFDHNYDWFDPSMVCGNPSLVPCDNNGHGTHTMGTMAGDDGDPGPNQIGVAPHARFIAAKGCETNSCSSSALLASAQWILAPTNLAGGSPRPDLRPHIVNNSWGGGGGDPWYQASVDAWIASGIFPAFSNGNAGPGCGSSGSPGDYTQSYSAGAFDIGNNIAGFSSRGPSAFGGTLKPNIAAPGVGVRSSVPTNSYASFSGTSMASPHVAGTVALIWSAAPAIERDIDATRTLLDTTAVDTSDLTCGGTAADNNVWGEGKLDAFAAVSAAPIGDTGTLTGMVTDASDNTPIAGATVHASGPFERTTMTNAAGVYSLTLPVGTYDVTASAFGFESLTEPGVVITDGGTTTQDFALTPADSHPVSGFVRDGSGNPLANATVTILNTPIPPATTDANGAYSFPSVPEGEYDVQATAGRCNDADTQHLVVDGPETLDFTLPQRSDSFGYFCRVEAVSWIDANTVLPLSGDDASTQISLPFSFTYYGQTHNTAHVGTNGFLNFLAPNATFFNSAIPSTGPPNGAIYPFWDDLFVDGLASVRTELLGAAPSRRFVIEWRNVHFFADSTRRVDFEVVLYENGRILTQYRNLANDGREKGNSATIGIENQAGTIALQYSFNEASLDDPEFAVLYRLPPSGFVEGRVTDYNDNLAVAGATVKAIRGGSVFRETTTDSNGDYRMQLPLDTYTIEASASNYETQSEEVVLDDEDEVVTQNFALRTARAEVSPNALEFIVPPDTTKTKQLVLDNTGSLDMTWQIQEAGGGQVATSSTQGISKDPGANPNAATTEGLYETKTPSGWSPTAPGDVLRTWPPTGLSLAWGVGYTGNVWLSDVPSNNRNHEFTVTGAPTGRNWTAPWAGAWPGDMALDTSNNCMAQVNVGGDNGIYCWNINTGAVVYSITGAFPWTGISQRGLAYRPDDNSFYIGGWNEGVVYHVRGRGAGQGEVIDSCNPPDGNISGLAWNSAFNILWSATNSPTDTIYQLNPSTCSVLSTLPHPSPGFGGAGLEMNEEGNLWIIDQSPNNVYLIESGVPAFSDVLWLSEEPSSGTLAPGDPPQVIDVTVDTAGMSPGVYNAILFIQSNSGRQPTLRIPVSLIVPAYRQGVNAGGGAYTDVAESDPWAADQAYSAGSWGYINRLISVRRNRPIAGTEDDPLYQDLSRGMSEYRFDTLPNGVYQVELRFAELSNRQPGQHIYDVMIEGNVVLFAHDVAAEVGTYTADDHSFFVPVTDGSLNVRFVARRGFGDPEINALRATHRPDR
jgi:subtilisin family serine protease